MSYIAIFSWINLYSSCIKHRVGSFNPCVQDLKGKEFMSDCFKGTDRRVDRRLEQSLPIALLNHKVNLENISPSGVYFEVATDDIEPFSVGRTVEFEILAKTHTPVSSSRTIRFTGSGKIIRNKKIGNNPYDKKFGIALTFSEKLKFYL
jgi:hypothetical protein